MAKQKSSSGMYFLRVKINEKQVTLPLIEMELTGNRQSVFGIR